MANIASPALMQSRYFLAAYQIKATATQRGNEIVISPSNSLEELKKDLDGLKGQYPITFEEESNSLVVKIATISKVINELNEAERKNIQKCQEEEFQRIKKAAPLIEKYAKIAGFLLKKMGIDVNISRSGASLVLIPKQSMEIELKELKKRIESLCKVFSINCSNDYMFVSIYNSQTREYEKRALPTFNFNYEQLTKFFAAWKEQSQKECECKEGDEVAIEKLEEYFRKNFEKLNEQRFDGNVWEKVTGREMLRFWNFKKIEAHEYVNYYQFYFIRNENTPSPIYMDQFLSKREVLLLFNKY